MAKKSKKLKIMGATLGSKSKGSSKMVKMAGKSAGKR